MDNPTTQTQDNGQTQQDVVTPEQEQNAPEQTQQQEGQQEGFSWKNRIKPDYANSPTLQKFDDSPEGLEKAMESHLNLEKLLGNEKVPIPKGPDDQEGWDRLNKAMGVPNDPKEYELGDPEFSGAMKDLSFDKDTFAQVVHKHNLTPQQAQGLWNEYTEMMGNTYSKQAEAYQNTINENINALRKEWGDSYDSNVELGQAAIDKIAGDDKEMADFLTATMTKNPKGMQFLKRVGDQFAENKIGGFEYKKFSLSPDEAQEKLDKITSDPNHPYRNEDASDKEHREAVDFVNRLYAVANKNK